MVFSERADIRIWSAGFAMLWRVQNSGPIPSQNSTTPTSAMSSGFRLDEIELAKTNSGSYGMKLAILRTTDSNHPARLNFVQQELHSRG